MPMMKRIARTDAKWFKERIADKKLSAARLARTLGLSPGTLSRKLDGYVKITLREAADIARVLGVSFNEIVFRAGISMPEANDESLIPISGTVNPFGVIESGPGSGPRRTERLPIVDKDQIALRIDNPSSPFNGSIVYYAPTVRLEPDAVGRLAVVQEPGKAGTRRLGVLQHGFERGTWRLHQLTLEPNGVEIPVEWAAPVQAVRS